MNTIITYILMFVALISASAYAGVNLPAFSNTTIFLKCDGIKLYGKPRPTVYFYALAH